MPPIPTHDSTCMHERKQMRYAWFPYLHKQLCNLTHVHTCTDRLAVQEWWSWSITGSLQMGYTSRALIGSYLYLIRPHREYAVPVWKPYLKKDVQKLESIQRFALKVCLKSWDGFYSDHLQACNKLPCLTDRRKMLCSMYLYKAGNGYVVNPNNVPLEPRIRCETMMSVFIYWRFLSPVLWWLMKRCKKNCYQETVALYLLGKSCQWIDCDSYWSLHKFEFDSPKTECLLRPYCILPLPSELYINIHVRLLLHHNAVYIIMRKYKTWSC